MTEASPEVQFALQFAMQAKSNIVYNVGIGAELRPAIVAFELDGTPIGFAQMKSPSQDAESALDRVRSVGALMRSGWCSASIAIVAEGFVSIRNPDLDPDEHECNIDDSLAKRFGAGDKNISECLTVAWASDGGDCELCMMPYVIGLGRKVFWDENEMLVIEDASNTGSYVGLLQNIVNGPTPVAQLASVPPELQMLAAANAMTTLGFYVKFTNDNINTDWINDDD